MPWLECASNSYLGSIWVKASFVLTFLCPQRCITSGITKKFKHQRVCLWYMSSRKTAQNVSTVPYLLYWKLLTINHIMQFWSPITSHNNKRMVLQPVAVTVWQKHFTDKKYLPSAAAMNLKYFCKKFLPFMWPKSNIFPTMGRKVLEHFCRTSYTATRILRSTLLLMYFIVFHIFCHSIRRLSSSSTYSFVTIETVLDEQK